MTLMWQLHLQRVNFKYTDTVIVPNANKSSSEPIYLRFVYVLTHKKVKSIKLYSEIYLSYFTFTVRTKSWSNWVMLPEKVLKQE